MSRKISVVARLLLVEMIRDRIFLTMAMAAIFLMLSSLILNEMVVGGRAKASLDLGLSMLSFFPLFVVIFLCIIV